MSISLLRAGIARAARLAPASAPALAPALALLALTALPAQAQRQEKPRIDAGRIAGEAIGGAYAGIGGFLIGRELGNIASDVAGVESEVTRRNVGYATGFAVSTLATTGVVYGIGSIGDQTGDFNATLLGTGVGFIAGAGIARLVLGPGVRPDPGMSTRARWATINALALLPAIGATIGFNSTRRFR